MNKNIFNKMMNRVVADNDLKQLIYYKIVSQKQQKRSLKSSRLLVTVSACIVLLIGVFSYFHLQNNIDQIRYSFITIDVNPSIEFILNKDDIVIVSKAYNDEGKDILDRISYQDESYQEVFQQLFQNDLYQNYLKNNTDIQVSVFCENKNKCQDLENKVNQCIQKYLSPNHHYDSICIDEKTHHLANDCHISGGRYVLIQEIMNCSSYSFDELENKSLSQLKELYSGVTQQESDLHHDKTDHHNGLENHHQLHH